MSVIFSLLLTPTADIPTHHLSTYTEKEPHAEAERNSSSLVDDEDKSLTECELYKNYPRDGFMTGCPLFNSLQEAYDVYKMPTNYERNQFDPSGNVENEWSATNLILEVGERKTPLKWSVTNCLFKHLQTDELVADEEMSKKQIFILLVKTSPGISDAIKRNFLTTEM
eukprot:705530-Ditylum_brightwellii.AAC.1